MKKMAITIFCILVGWRFALAETTPSLKLEVIRTLPHSGYSEGLDFHDGLLWHALPKQIVTINPEDGSVIKRFEPPTAHSESVKWVKGKLVHVSFADNGIYTGNVAGEKLALKKVGEVPEDRAWGVEFDGKHLILTGNYSDMLYFLDPKTWKVVRKVKTPVKDIEDLAWDGKYLWSSSFSLYRGQIFRIDPKDGSVGPFYSLPDPESCPVIDGLAYDGKGLWITGKECPSLFYVKLPK